MARIAIKSNIFEIPEHLKLIRLSISPERIHLAARNYNQSHTSWYLLEQNLRKRGSHRHYLPQFRPTMEAALKSMWLLGYETGKPPQGIRNLITQVEKKRPDLCGLFSLQMEARDRHQHDGYRLVNGWAHSDVDLLAQYDRADLDNVLKPLRNMVAYAQHTMYIVEPDVMSPEAILSGKYL